ncbi:MAG: hypothetical protein FKY71_13960, partial [Spiribacter salinus]
MHTPAPGRLASFEPWDDLVRQTVVWADSALAPGQFGDPMDLVREAQAADPEADALFALLDALRDQFSTAEFTAKDVQARANGSITQSPLEVALVDLAGDRALASARSLGRVLKFREGRIVHGLRLTGRQDMHSKVRTYAIKSDSAGFAGFAGFSASHTEKGEAPLKYKWGETN